MEAIKMAGSRAYSRAECEQIRADRDSGMGVRAMLSKYSMGFAVLQSILNGTYLTAEEGGGTGRRDKTDGSVAVSYRTPSAAKQAGAQTQIKQPRPMAVMRSGLRSAIGETEIRPLILEYYQRYIEAGYEGRLIDWLEEIVAEWFLFGKLRFWFEAQSASILLLENNQLAEGQVADKLWKELGIGLCQAFIDEGMEEEISEEWMTEPELDEALIKYVLENDELNNKNGHDGHDGHTESEDSITLLKEAESDGDSRESNN
jgi:hypothetical protein